MIIDHQGTPGFGAPVLNRNGQLSVAEPIESFEDNSHVLFCALHIFPLPHDEITLKFCYDLRMFCPVNFPYL